MGIPLSPRGPARAQQYVKYHVSLKSWVCSPDRQPIAPKSLIDVSRKSVTVVLMPKAVPFDSYGGADVLEVRDVPCPVLESSPSTDVRDAFWEVELRHTRGNLVLRP